MIYYSIGLIFVLLWMSEIALAPAPMLLFLEDIQRQIFSAELMLLLLPWSWQAVPYYAVLLSSSRVAVVLEFWERSKFQICLLCVIAC